ncbi:MAG: AI-2E family transporter, partial [Microcystaceae cyanobacterium]
MKLNNLVSFLSLIIALIILWQFRQILLLIFTAMVIAIALNALVRRLVDKFQISRGSGVLVVLSLALLVIVIFFLLFIPLVVNQSQQVIQLMPTGVDNLSSYLDNLKSNPPPFLPESILEGLKFPDWSELRQQVSSLLTNIFGRFY